VAYGIVGPISSTTARHHAGRPACPDRRCVAILKELPPYLASVPNRISITGHTDATPYVGSGGYSNWELSADRANAARRVLVSSGLPASKIGRVIGLADSAPVDKLDPLSPINRRISIIVMTHEVDRTPEGLAQPPQHARPPH
jgi:chemotaxis protein MotB